LNRILTDGPPLGIHVLCSCDTYNNATRSFGRKALSEFELRVLFQMSAGDSASLIDNPKAASLGLHRALLYNAQEGSLETFRPLRAARRRLAPEFGRATVPSARITAFDCETGSQGSGVAQEATEATETRGFLGFRSLLEAA
jgi:hypothetical protein